MSSIGLLMESVLLRFICIILEVERGVKSARKIVDASMIDKKHCVITGFIRAASSSGYAAACSRLHIGEVLF